MSNYGRNGSLENLGGIVYDQKLRRRFRGWLKIDGIESNRMLDLLHYSWVNVISIKSDSLARGWVGLDNPLPETGGVF